MLDCALGLFEIHEVYMGPPLKLVHLGGTLFLKYVYLTTQLHVIGKLDEGSPKPTVHIAKKDVKAPLPTPILIHQFCNPVVEGHQICQAQFSFSEAMLAVINQLLFSPCALA